MVLLPEEGSRFYSPEGDQGAGGANASGKAAVTGTGGEAGQGSKTFTQDQLDGILKERLSEERRRNADKLSELDTLRTSVSEMQRQLHQKSVGDAEAQKQYEEAKRLREEGYAKEQDKLKRELAETQERYRRTAIDNSLLAQASAYKALKPDHVVALLKDQVKLDDTGTPRFSDGSSVEDGVKKFLAENPNMVMAGGKGGSGSTTTKPGESGQGVSLEGKTAEQIREMNPNDVLAALRAATANPFVTRS